MWLLLGSVTSKLIKKCDTTEVLPSRPRRRKNKRLLPCKHHRETLPVCPRPNVPIGGIASVPHRVSHDYKRLEPLRIIEESRHVVGDPSRPARARYHTVFTVRPALIGYTHAQLVASFQSWTEGRAVLIRRTTVTALVAWLILQVWSEEYEREHKVRRNFVIN